MPPTAGARNSSRRSDGASAQCRLSRTRRCGASAAARFQKPVIASNRRNRACVASAGRSHRREVGDALREVRQDLGEIARAGVEQRPQARVVVRLGARADHLQPRPERRRARLLVAAAPQHAHVAVLRVAGEHLGGAGLADPRLAGEHHDPALAGERLVEGGAERGELALAADEHLAAAGDLGAHRVGDRAAQRCAAGVAEGRFGAVHPAALGACCDRWRRSLRTSRGNRPDVRAGHANALRRASGSGAGATRPASDDHAPGCGGCSIIRAPSCPAPSYRPPPPAPSSASPRCLRSPSTCTSRGACASARTATSTRTSSARRCPTARTSTR